MFQGKKRAKCRKTNASQLQVAAATDGARATCQKPDAIPGAAVSRAEE